MRAQPTARQFVLNRWMSSTTVGVLVATLLTVPLGSREAGAAELIEGESLMRATIYSDHGDRSKEPPPVIFTDALNRSLSVSNGSSTVSMTQNTTLRRSPLTSIVSKGSTKGSGPDEIFADDNDVTVGFELTSPQRVTIVGTLKASSSNCSRAGARAGFYGPFSGYAVDACGSEPVVEIDDAVDIPPGSHQFFIESEADSDPGTSKASWDLTISFACGETITTSLTLPHDLDCPGDGLIIGAPDITLDLGGHRMTGDGDAEDVGVDNNGGHDGVRIRNGEIKGFGNGINLFEANENRLRGLLIFENAVNGILMSASSGNNVNHVTLRQNGSNGLRLLSGDTNTFDSNLVESNAGNGMVIGIEDRPAPSNIFTRNRVQANGGNGIALGGASPHHSILRENKVDGNGASGIDATNAPSSIFRENKTRDNTLYGIQIREVACTTPCNEPLKLIDNVSSGSTTTDGMLLTNVQGAIVRGNRVNNNDGRGIQVSRGSDNRIESNIANGNGRDAGIRLFVTSGNELVGNTTNANGTTSGDPVDGILVEGSGDVDADSNTLRVNAAIGNTRDGFNVSDASDNHLIANTARENNEDGFHVDILSIANDLRNNRSVRNLGIGYNIEHPSTTGANNAASGNGFLNCFAPQGSPVC